MKATIQVTAIVLIIAMIDYLFDLNMMYYIGASLTSGLILVLDRLDEIIKKMK